MVGFDPVRSRFIDLNQSATELFHTAAASGTSGEALGFFLEEAYSLPPHDANAIAESFLAQMRTEGWL